MVRRSLVILFLALLALGCDHSDDKRLAIELRKEINGLKTRVSRIENDLKTLATQSETRRQSPTNGVDVDMLETRESIHHGIDSYLESANPPAWSRN